MARWLNRLLDRPYSLKISTLPFGAEAGVGETMLHATFQCLNDLVSRSDFSLQNYESHVQNEIVELYWWWKSVRPYRTYLMSSDLCQKGIDARTVYMKEDTKMLERLVILRSHLVL